MLYPWDGVKFDEKKGGKFIELCDSSKDKIIQHARVFAEVDGFIDFSLLLDFKNKMSVVSIPFLGVC